MKQNFEVLKLLEKTGIKIETISELPYSLLSIMQEEISRKEVAHSKIIASLLSPYQKHDFKFVTVTKFLKKIGITDFASENVTNFKVSAEENIKGRFIDILITWEENSGKYAVIVENKLNYAKDQPNQLNDYFIGINESYKIKKVVYMPIDPFKSAKHTDTSKGVLAITIDFGIGKLIDWLTECILSLESSGNIQPLIIYRDLLEHMFNKYRNLMKSIEIQQECSNDELSKLIELATIVSSDDWHNAKYTLLAEAMSPEIKNSLIVTPKGKSAELYFRTYEFWVELWSYEKSIDLYICSYKINDLKTPITIADSEFEFYSNSNDKYYYWNKDCSFNYPQDNDKLKIILEKILKELSLYKDAEIS